MDDYIDVSDIDPGELLAGLYNAARPLGLGIFADMQRGGVPMTAEEARSIISDGGEYGKLKAAGLTVLPKLRPGEWKVDYVHGRPLKVRVFNGQLFGSWLYDRDHGPGACARVVASLRLQKGGH